MLKTQTGNFIKIKALQNPVNPLTTIKEAHNYIFKVLDNFKRDLCMPLILE